MANYPIKMLKDENGTPFVPLVAPGAINDGQGFDLLTELDKKLEKTNIIAGDNVTITTSGNDITINSAAGGASANVIDNLNQETGGVGVLDAHQGHVLKGMIPEVADNLTTVDNTKALSAYQGYLLDNRLNVDEETLDDLDEAINSVEESKKTIQGGNDILIEGASEGSIIKYQIDGKCEQTQTTGKNLLNYHVKYTPGTTITLGGVSVTFNDDDSITLNGTMTENNIEITGSENILQLPIDNTKTYYSLVKVVEGSYSKSGTVDPVVAYDCKYNSGSSTNYRNYSLPSSTTSTQINVSDAEYITRYRIWQDSSRGNTTFNNFKVKFAIYQGDISTNWENYTGGEVSPSPNYPQEVKAISSIVNLFDENTISSVVSGAYENGLITTDESGQTQNYNVAPNFPTLRFKNGNTYYLSADIRRKSGSGNFGKMNDYIANWDAVKSPAISSEFQRYIFKKTYTSDTSTTRLLFQFQGVDTAVFEIKNIMIECSSKSHDYVPYGHFLKIKNTGKNIFDFKKYFEGAYCKDCTKQLLDNGIKISFTAGADVWLGDARKLSSGSTIALKNIAIAVKPNTNYVLSADGFPHCYVTYMDKDYNVVNDVYISVPSSYTSASYAFTTPNNANYVSFRLGIKDNQYTEWSFTNIQLEEGSQVSSYESYKEKQILVDLKDKELCKIGDYKDTLSVDSSGNVIINKKIGKVVFDGSENWDKWDTQVSGKYRYRIGSFDIIEPVSYNQPSFILSSHFVTESGRQCYAGTQGICSQVGNEQIGNSIMIVHDDFPDDLNSFKGWLSTHNTSVYYVLKTPETITLSNTNIPLYEGINHITFVDDLDTQTEITYYAQNAFDDIYYNKQQVNDRIQGLIPEGGQSGQVLMQNDQGEITWGDAADPNAIVGDGSIKKIIELTYADYQALETVDPDTEYHILDAASSLDNLQATLDSLQEQINDLKTPNYITGSPAEAIVLNGTAWQVYDIPLTMINLQGTGLSIEDGKIKIGSNITNIRYDAHFNWHRDSGTVDSQAVYFRLNLIRNGTKHVINQQIDILQPGFYGGAQFSSNWVVQEGDLISLGYMVATSDSYSSITAGYFETFLTVEKIS